MPVDLIKRGELGSPLSAEQHDENMTDIEEAINAAEARIDASLDENGKFKAESLDDVSAIVDHLITLVKLTAGTAKAFLVSDESGDVTVLTGTDGQLVGFGADDAPVALDPEEVFESTSGVFLYDNPAQRVSTTTEQSSWQTLDLTSDITFLGATGATAAILQLETFVDETDTDTQTRREVLLRVTSSDVTSTSATSTHRSRAYSFGAANNRFPCASDVNTAIVKMDGTNVYWNADFTNAPSGSYARIGVVGFLKA